MTQSSAHIISVHSSDQSAPWDDLAQALEVVRSGLQNERYIVLTVDQGVSQAAQGTQLAYSNFVNCQEDSAAVHGLQRLQDKTLLEYKPGHSATPDLIAPWLTESAASFAGIADAVLRMCLRAVGMPANCLAGVLDDLPPLPNVAPESLLQAASYNGNVGFTPEERVDSGLLTVVWNSSPALQVYTVAGGWQHVQLLYNQVAVFAGVVLQYATAGAIPAALYAYGAAKCQPLVRSSQSVSLAYSQRPAAHAIVDLRNVPGFVPDSRYPHPLVVSHAPALAVATLRNIYLPPARNSATQSGGPAPAPKARDLQHEEAGQLRQSKRARTSGSFHTSQPAPLQGAETGEEHPPAALAHGTSEQQPMEIFMKTLIGRTHTFIVDRSTTIQEFTYMVQDKTGFPPSQTRLVFAGKQLENCRTFADYNIQPRSILHHIIRLRGD